MKKVSLDPFEEKDHQEESRGGTKKLFLLAGALGLVVLLLLVVYLTLPSERPVYRPWNQGEEFERVGKEKIFLLAKARRELLESLSSEEISRMAEVLGVSPEQVKRAILEGRLTKDDVGKLLSGKATAEEVEEMTARVLGLKAVETEGERPAVGGGFLEKLTDDEVKVFARALNLSEEEVRRLLREGALRPEDVRNFLSGSLTREQAERIAGAVGIPVSEIDRLSKYDGLSERELREASKVLGISEKDLRRLIEEGKLSGADLNAALNGDPSAVERVARALREAADEIGLTDEEIKAFAEALGLDEGEVRRFLREGKLSPKDVRSFLKGDLTTDQVRRLADVLGLPASEVLEKAGITGYRGPSDRASELSAILSDEELDRAARALGVDRSVLERAVEKDPELAKAIGRFLEGRAGKEDVSRIARGIGRTEEYVRRRTVSVVPPPSVERKVENRIKKLREEIRRSVRSGRPAGTPAGRDGERAERRPIRPPGSPRIVPPVSAFESADGASAPGPQSYRRSEVGVSLAALMSEVSPGEKTAEEPSEDRGGPVLEGTIDLPDGGFFIATLMDSIVAVEGFSYDLLLVADSDYRTPVGTFPFRNCTVSVRVQANPVSRRIEPVRVNSVTCILDNGRYYRTEDVSGYFADYEDNVRGLKGILKSADVQKAFLMVLGQVAQSGGQALALASVSTTTTPFGQIQSVESAGRFITGTALQATGQAIMEVLQKLGKKYVDYIIVEPMDGKPRKVYFYFTSPLRLYPYGIEKLSGKSESK